MKDWDFGYFGKGIDGYVHYMQAFNRNFPQNSKQSDAKRAKPRPSYVPPKEQGSLLEDLAELAGLFMIIVIQVGILLLLE